MLIDMTKVLIDLEGNPYQEKDDVQLTLGSAIGNILVVQKASNPWQQYKLTILVAKAKGKVDLKAEDIVFIKKLLEQNAAGEYPRYYPYIIGQCIDLLETKDEDAKESSKEEKKK